MIRFMKYRWLYLLISSIVLVPGIISLILFGVKPSIDFTGGTLLEFEISQDYQDRYSQDSIAQLLSKNNIDASEIIQNNASYLIKAKYFDKDTNYAFQTDVASISGVATISAILTEKRFETLGPVLGSETLKKALSAISLAALSILLYVWKQFKDKKYGISAILAMLHDTLISFGIFSLLGHFYGIEVDTLFMTAVLTILSFSIHDTIVVYDRIRESIKRYPSVPFEVIIDKAVNETMGRSLNNSMTIIFMLLALFILGGETTKWFSFALLIGTVSGTYSSPFVAAPLLLVWDKFFSKRK